MLKNGFRFFVHTRCIIPAAVNHTDIKMDTNWAKRIELDVFKTFKYCNISGTVIRRNARRNRRPACGVQYFFVQFVFVYCACSVGCCSCKISLLL